MDRQTAADILTRYRYGNCTEAEQQLVESWILHGTSGPLDLSDAELLEDLLDLRLRLRHELHGGQPKVFRVRKWLPYAAAVILIVMAGILAREQGLKNKIQEQAQTDILPGGNRATLTLADGRILDLSEVQEGIIVGDQIKYADGSTVLTPENQESGSPQDGSPGTQQGSLDTQHATLTTPKGGTYQIVLPDGTKVWLNSASRLKYPSRFSSNERVVELEGEAYFEVASLPMHSSGRRQPFIVKTRFQTIEVLGTHFNISAYTDDSKVKTTLVEGSVRVALSPLPGSTERASHPATILKPGQQSVVRRGEVNILNVEISPYIAWKNGNFYFNNTSLSDMMKQIARWYDVEVIYEGRVPRERFSGSMSRNVTLQTVLELLKISEIKYRIEGKKLIIE